jgi:hypothetical protein
MSRVKVSLTPLGTKVRIRLQGKVLCPDMNTELRNSLTIDCNDLICKRVFGSYEASKKFCAGSKSKTKVVTLSDLGYDQCDKRI